MKSRKKDKLDTKKENTKEAEIEIKTEEVEERVIEEKEVFSNYESDFNKNKVSILERVGKFKDFVKPKTRI